MGKIIQKIKRYLPVTQKELTMLVEEFEKILEAVETMDAQHTKMEHEIITRLQEKSDKDKGDITHPEFG